MVSQTWHTTVGFKFPMHLSHLKRYMGFLVCKRQMTTARKMRLVHPRESANVWCILYDVSSVTVENLNHFPYSRRAHCGIAGDMWMNVDCLISYRKPKQEKITTTTINTDNSAKWYRRECQRHASKSVVDYIQDIQHTFSLPIITYAQTQSELKVKKKKLLKGNWSENENFQRFFLYFCYNWISLKLVRNRENSESRT